VGVDLLVYLSNSVCLICLFTACVPPAIFFALVPYARCDTTLSAIFFIAAISLNGFCFSGLYSTHVDMAPDHAGTLMGITNSVGNVPGFLTEIVAEQFNKQGVSKWKEV